MSVLFAATYPERTAALITFGIFARRTPAPDYPWAPTPEARERWYQEIEKGWGGPVDLSSIAPSRAGDGRFQEWFATYLRMGASPGAAVALGRMNTAIDVRAVLPAIRVPTLVLHQQGDRDVNVAEARYIAARIPGARLVELSGEDHFPWTGDQDAVLDEIQEFLTGVRPVPEPDRVLATVLYTDIVGSTERAAAIGDARWRDVLEAHHGVVRKELARWSGREVGTAGDGFVALFDGPARGIRCALAIHEAVRELDLEIRAGLHTGEMEVTRDAVGGIAMHIGARVGSAAKAGEVLVSSTVRDLVAGSGLAFADRGLHTLKGVAEEWHLFAVVS